MVCTGIQNGRLCTPNPLFHLSLVGDGISETFDAGWDSLPSNIGVKVQFDCT